MAHVPLQPRTLLILLAILPLMLERHEAQSNAPMPTKERMQRQRSHHVPHYYTRTWVYEAFRAFRDFLTEDRYNGMLSQTAIYNYAVRRHALPWIWSHDHPIRTGFYGSCPATPAAIAHACANLPFLSFDDPAFTSALQQFLAARFPDKCRYDR